MRHAALLTAVLLLGCPSEDAPPLDTAPVWEPVAATGSEGAYRSDILQNFDPGAPDYRLPYLNGTLAIRFTLPAAGTPLEEVRVGHWRHSSTCETVAVEVRLAAGGSEPPTDPTVVWSDAKVAEPDGTSGRRWITFRPRDADGDPLVVGDTDVVWALVRSEGLCLLASDGATEEQTDWFASELEPPYTWLRAPGTGPDEFIEYFVEARVAL